MKAVTRNFPFRTTFPFTSFGESSAMSLTFTMRRMRPSESKKVAISWKFPVTVIGIGIFA